MRLAFFIPFLCWIGQMSALHAQTPDTTSRAPAPTGYTIDLKDPVGFLPTVGLGTGYIAPNERYQTEGVPTQIKLLGSYYFDTKDWIADFGLGFSRVGFSQTSNADSVILTGFIEGGARYQLQDRWQVGGVTDVFVGRGERFGSTSKDLTAFVGPEISKEWDYNSSYLFRVGARVMTDLNVSGESVNMALLTLDIGMDPGNHPGYVVREEAAPTRTVSAANTVPIGGLIDKERGLHFQSGTVIFDQLSKKNMNRVANALSRNAGLYDRIEVVGHADRRGSTPSNLALSERRAITVARALAFAGVPKSKILENWKGEADPLSHASTPSALRLNRRVELRLHGVKDKEKLNEVLSALR